MTAQGARADNCQLSITQPRVDYGVIRREPFDERSRVTLGTRTLHLNIQCDEPSPMMVRFNGVASDGQGFRFGREGRFRLRLKQARVDGLAVQWRERGLPGESAIGQLLPGHTLVAQSMGRRLTAQVDIDTDLPSHALQVRSQTLLEGQGSFELVTPAVPPSR
ncbi:hypothetical protein ACW9IB_21890 [Pseudomonas sp. SDO524_S393]